MGFGSPVALLGGFIFGKWIGTLLVVLGLSVGATFIYLFGNYFLKELIREKFLNKFIEIKKIGLDCKVVSFTPSSIFSSIPFEFIFMKSIFSLNESMDEVET